MVTIRKGQEPYTLINVFHVTPENQREVADKLNEASEPMRQQPGFISANIHSSYDGKRVVNYAQWRSQEDFKAMMGNAKAQPHMSAIAALAESYDPILCEVVGSFEV